MKIPVIQGNTFLKDHTFAAAKESYESQSGKVYTMTMIETILHNPFPIKECPGNNTYAINTEQDCVFYKDDRFELIVDARGFKRKHIICKIKKNSITITGNDKLKAIFASWVTANKRKLKRSYRLPKNVNPANSTCALSLEGILVLTAPWDRN